MNDANKLKWFNYPMLYDRIYSELKNGDTFVEIGALYGASTIYMANLIRNGNKLIKYFTVDLWEKFDNTEDYLNENVFTDKESIFEEFLNNINSEGLTDYVIPIKRDSTEASEMFKDNSINAIMFDGCHQYYKLNQDIKAWLPKMVPGAIMAGDDYGHPCFPGIKIAVDENFSYYELISTETPENFMLWYKQL